MSLLKQITALLTFIFASMSFHAHAAQADDLVGYWYTAEKESIVHVTKSGHTYGGQIVWLKEPNFKAGHAQAGQPVTDVNNPEAKLKTRSIIGLPIAWGMKFDGDDTWEGGRVYDPKTGKTYQGKMWMDDANTLNLKGFVGVSVLGRSSKWTRTTAPK